MPALAANWLGADETITSLQHTSNLTNKYGYGSGDDNAHRKAVLNGNDWRVEPNGSVKLKSPTSSTSHTAASEGIPSPKIALFKTAEQLHQQWCLRRTVGCGLANLGNTCFLNSVLQCLTYTAPLNQFLYNAQHKKHCRLSGFCVLCSLTDLMSSMFSSSGQAIKPLDILRNLKNIAKCLTWSHQEDAHEFLRYTVDAMQKSCLAGYTGLDDSSKCTTVVHEIFGGYLRSQVRCDRCHYDSNTYDPNLDISVDLKNVESLEAALKRFVMPESLDLENAYKCEKCKLKVTAKKRFSIHQASRVLTIHLKRFDMHRMLGAKVSRHIAFPPTLNIRPYMSNPQGEPITYSLYGVLVHSGFSCHSGHYYSYIKAPNNSWYCMNDSSVTQVSLSSVLSSEAYILFYVRSFHSVQKMKGLPPYTATRPEMLNGSGDYNEDRKFIGPELPLSVTSNRPQRPQLLLHTKSGSKLVPTANGPKPALNSNGNNTTASTSRASLVPYSDKDDNDESCQQVEATPAVCTDDLAQVAEHKPVKLTLREYYNSRHEESNHKPQVNTALSTKATMFTPRSILTPKLNKNGQNQTTQNNGHSLQNTKIIEEEPAKPETTSDDLPLNGDSAQCSKENNNSESRSHVEKQDGEENSPPNGWSNHRHSLNGHTKSAAHRTSAHSSPSPHRETHACSRRRESSTPPRRKSSHRHYSPEHSLRSHERPHRKYDRSPIRWRVSRSPERRSRNPSRSPMSHRRHRGSTSPARRHRSPDHYQRPRYKDSKSPDDSSSRQNGRASRHHSPSTSRCNRSRHNTRSRSPRYSYNRHSTNSHSAHKSYQSPPYRRNDSPSPKRSRGYDLNNSRSRKSSPAFSHKTSSDKYRYTYSSKSRKDNSQSETNGKHSNGGDNSSHKGHSNGQSKATNGNRKNNLLDSDEEYQWVEVTKSNLPKEASNNGDANKTNGRAQSHKEKHKSFLDVLTQKLKPKKHS